MKQMHKTMENNPVNQDVFAGQWKQMRGELKSWWGKLADDDFERIGGQKDKLIGVVQEKYGYAREKAQQEVERRFNEYSDRTGGPNGAPHEGAIATAVAAVAGGLQSAEGAIGTAATAVADGLQSASSYLQENEFAALATDAATAVVGGLQSARGAISTAATAVADGLQSAEGAIGTAATAVADGLQSASSYLQENEFAAMTADLTALMRRYPVQSLVVGIGLGYVLARLTAR